MPQALAGLRVLDLAELEGHYVGRLLADMGADVIKVEPPGGDPARNRSPFAGGIRDPERSLVFANFNANKRGIVVDVDSEDGQQALKRLAATADILIETAAPGSMDQRSVGYTALREINPRLIYVSLTPFGLDGPHTGYKALDLHIQAMGGMMMIQGDDERAPCMAPAQQGYQMGSLHAAMGAMLAVIAREKTGRGQFVEVSMQEVIANTFFQVVRFSALGEIERRPGRGTNLPLVGIFQARDGGWINMTPLTPGHIESVFEWVGDPRFAGPEWRERDHRQANAEVLVGALTNHVARFDAAFYVDEAQERRIPCELVALPADFANSPQIASRDYFKPIHHPAIGDHTMPGAPFRMSETPWELTRPAPVLGQHDDEVLRTPGPAAVAGGTNGTGRSGLPLEGVRVVDFTRVWVGPYATRHLADYGAEVIKIESGLFDTNNRTSPIPMAGDLNRNKKSITLDLHHPEAQDIAKRLIAESDVVVDNFAVDVMDRFGIGYEDLRNVKPDIIQMSMPGWGNTGPFRNHVSYGGQVLSASGLGYLWGHPESPPSARAKFPYADFLVAVHGAFASLVALYHRGRTEIGQYVEVPQEEAMGHTMGVPLLDHFINGNPGEPVGNSHRDHSPHGVYPCRGDDAWAAIACTSDEEWRGLRTALDDPEWMQDPGFDTVQGRLVRTDEIDALLTTWTVEKTPKQVMYLLQRAGVPAAAVQNTEDVYHDVHMNTRGYTVELDHPDFGLLRHAGLTVRLSETPGSIHSASPALGQDTENVLESVLGLSSEAIKGLRDAKAVA
jgi:crotonobetainyl-CoA:carnitine CoA-transferase CaiB-like acyl-CoA transferase